MAAPICRETTCATIGLARLPEIRNLTSVPPRDVQAIIARPDGRWLPRRPLVHAAAQDERSGLSGLWLAIDQYWPSAARCRRPAPPAFRQRKTPHDLQPAQKPRRPWLPEGTVAASGRKGRTPIGGGKWALPLSLVAFRGRMNSQRPLNLFWSELCRYSAGHGGHQRPVSKASAKLPASRRDRVAEESLFSSQ
jgi:hypothetical protein